MTDSINMRHFPEYDPPTHTSKAVDRDRVALQMQEYERAGGQITQLTNQDYNRHKASMKRAELIDYLKQGFRRRQWNNGRGEW